MKKIKLNMNKHEQKIYQGAYATTYHRVRKHSTREAARILGRMAGRDAVKAYRKVEARRAAKVFSKIPLTLDKNLMGPWFGHVPSL